MWHHFEFGKGSSLGLGMGKFVLANTVFLARIFERLLVCPVSFRFNNIFRGVT